MKTNAAAGQVVRLHAEKCGYAAAGADDAVNAPRISAQDVTKEFFDALEIPVLAGRGFSASNAVTGAEPAVLVVTVARRVLAAALVGLAIGVVRALSGRARLPAWR